MTESRIPKPEYFERVKEKSVDFWTSQTEDKKQLRRMAKQIFEQVGDPEFVISELLQNADDAGATSVKIKIDDGYFYFEHFGGHDFTEKEFRALCNMSMSSKDTFGTTGFRGIGFKSTFSIGDVVHLQTPSLAVYFDKKRFTEPVWDDEVVHKINHTRIKILMKSEGIFEIIKNSISKWKNSGYSMLFFRNIKELELNGSKLEIKDSDKKSIIENSCYYKYETNNGIIEPLKVSVQRSVPSKVAEEIRDKRDIPENEPIPDFIIDIIFGIPKNQNSFYVVLPTNTWTDLNISINAPFILTPDRKNIDHPETCETNKWILSEVGSFVADIIKKILDDNSLTIKDRCKAYDFLPPSNLTQPGDKILIKEITSYVSEHPIVLSEDGTISEKCIQIPGELFDVWDIQTLHSLYSDLALPFSHMEVEKYSSRLKEWGLIISESNSDFCHRFISEKIPCPETNEKTIKLWICFSKYYAKCSNKAGLKISGSKHQYVEGDEKKYKLFPKIGCKYLSDGEYIIRVGGDFSDNIPDLFYEIINSYNIGIVDPEFDKLLTEISGNPNIQIMLKKMDKTDIPTEETVIKDLSQYELEDKDVVSLAYLAAYWNTNVPGRFSYLSQSSELFEVEDKKLIYDPNKILEILYSADELNSTIISDRYLSDIKLINVNEWNAWASSPKSKLEKPLEIIETNDGDYQLNDAFLNLITSYASDDEIWADVLSYILDSGTDYELKTFSRKRKEAAGWVKLFSDKKCLRGEDRKTYYPYELYFKNEATSLLDGETFLSESYSHASQEILEELGVSFKPGVPHKLIDMLKKLSFDRSNDVDNVYNLYGRLDIILKASDSDVVDEVKDIFHNEHLILTDDGYWVSNDNVYRDNTDIPRTHVVNSKLKDFSFIQKFVTKLYPRKRDYINYLNTLDEGELIPDIVRNSVISCLNRFPYDVAEETGHWISIDNHWVDFERFKYYTCDEKLIEILYDNFKNKLPNILILLKKGDKENIIADYLDADKIEDEITFKAIDIVELPPNSVPKIPDFIGIISSFLLNEFHDSSSYVYEEMGRTLSEFRIKFLKSFTMVPFIEGNRIGYGKNGVSLIEDSIIYIVPYKNHNIRKDMEIISDALSSYLSVKYCNELSIYLKIHKILNISPFIQIDELLEECYSTFEIETETNKQEYSIIDEDNPIEDDDYEEYYEGDDSTEENNVSGYRRTRQSSSSLSLGKAIDDKTIKDYSKPSRYIDDGEEEYPDFDPERYEERIAAKQYEVETDYLGNSSLDDDDDDLVFDGNSDDYPSYSTTSRKSRSYSSSRTSNNSKSLSYSSNVRRLPGSSEIRWCPSRRAPVSNENERAFLFGEYGGRCQICGAKLPKLKEGKFIYWGVNLWNNIPPELKEGDFLGWNSLSLCPNCASRYRDSGELPPNFETDVCLRDVVTNEANLVNIYIRKEIVPVRYSPKHFARLQAVMKKRLERERNDRNLGDD